MIIISSIRIIHENREINDVCINIINYKIVLYDNIYIIINKKNLEYTTKQLLFMFIHSLPNCRIIICRMYLTSYKFNLKIFQNIMLVYVSSVLWHSHS